MHDTRPTMTVLIPTFGSFLDDWRGLVDLAAAADVAGVDRIQVVDHLVMGPHPDAYPWGRFPTDSDAPWLEPLAVLAAIAGATERVRLATGILIAPLRPAAVLAKTAATIDVISRGRLDLGVGTGWQPEEYASVGLRFAERGDLLDETLEACTTLWTDAPATIRIGGAEVSDLWCRPSPVQPQGVPVWIGGSLHRRNLDRLTRYGSGWIPIMGATIDDVADGRDVIEAALRKVGRKPASLDIQVPLPLVKREKAIDLERSLEAVPTLVDAGASDILVPIRAIEPDPRAAAEQLERAVSDFREASR